MRAGPSERVPAEVVPDPLGGALPWLFPQAPGSPSEQRWRRRMVHLHLDIYFPSSNRAECDITRRYRTVSAVTERGITCVRLHICTPHCGRGVGWSATGKDIIPAGSSLALAFALPRPCSSLVTGTLRADWPPVHPGSATLVPLALTPVYRPSRLEKLKSPSCGYLPVPRNLQP